MTDHQDPGGAGDLGRPARTGLLHRRGSSGGSGAGRERRRLGRAGLGRYIVRRLLVIPPLLWAIVTLAFVTTRLNPTDPILSIVGDKQMQNPQVVDAARERWGLDGSLLEQYLAYLKNVLLHFDFGISFSTRQPVTSDIMTRLPATLELVISALIVGSVCGILLGLVAARRRGTVVDHGIRGFALLGSSLPVFWSGLIALSVFYVSLGWLPGPGRVPPRVAPPPHQTGFHTVDSLLAGDLVLFGQVVQHLVLPSLVLGWALIGIISRLCRSALIDEISSDYVRTARMKGLSESAAVYRHALRNAILPVITIIGFSFATLITGAVLTESVFAWNGIGSYAVQASRTLDYPAISGVCIVGGLAFLLINLLTDVAYAFADPKIQL